MSKNNKTCGECKHFDKIYSYCCITPDLSTVNIDNPVCVDFAPKSKQTNGDVIRNGNNRELAEISIREVVMPNGEVIYRSTLIDNKFFFTKNCAVSAVEAWLNAPAESEGEDA